MDRGPKFSVIVTTYNRGNLLKRAIDSILSQTFADFELIVVDDGSTDSTESMVRNYSDTRITYLYKTNGGQNSAINAGIKKSSGEYIAFCDSDDSWLPEKLEKHIIKYISDPEIKVVYDLAGKMTDGNLEAIRDDNCEGWCYKTVLEQGYLASPTFLTCKKECFEKIGLLPENLVNCQDDDLCLKLCKYYKVGLIKEILGIFHTDAENRISNMRDKCAEDYFNFWKSYSDEVIKECGIISLKKKFLKAAHKFCQINEPEKLKEIFTILQKKLGEDLMSNIEERISGVLNHSRRVILYGTGENAKSVYMLLNYLGINLEYIVAVTSINDNNKEFLGLEVNELKDLKEKQYCYLPVVIASEKYYVEMKQYAENMDFSKIIRDREILYSIFSVNQREDQNTN